MNASPRYFALRHQIANARRDIDFVTALIRCGCHGPTMWRVEFEALRRWNEAEDELERLEGKVGP